MTMAMEQIDGLDVKLPRLHATGEEPTSERIRATLNALATYGAEAGQPYEPTVGHIGAILTPAQYVDYVQQYPGVAAPFVPPPRPPDQPVIPPGATGPQITEINRQHKERVQHYRHFQRAMATAKTAFLAAGDDEFFEELKDGTSGYATVSLRALINHIRDEYDDYDADVRKELNEQLTLPWDGGKITTVIARINAVAAIHAAHNQPLSEQQKCDALHNAVRAHGSLNKDCTKWTSKPVADQMWANCLSHFKAAYKAHKKEATTQSGGYANFAELANITEAATNALERNNAMYANMATTAQDHEGRLKKLEQLLAAKSDLPTHGYCWTCGICDHRSKTCKTMQKGHKSEATGTNRMGGSTRVHPDLYRIGLRLQSE